MPFLRQKPGPMPSATQPPEFTVLYRTHAKQVARWVRHIGGPLLDVDDLVQDIFLVVRRRLPAYRGDGQISTWLYRITSNVVRAARRRERLRRMWPRERRAEVERTLGRAHLTPVEDLERRQASQLVYRMLDRLPEKYRSVVILFELEEMSGDEIAALTGLKVATVWVRLHRGRAQFLREVQREQRQLASAGVAS